MIHCGDSLIILKTLPNNSVDSLITDPPAGISFMGKGWDDDKGGRDTWIEWMSEVMRECMRVMKPGAHGLVWALPRTSHWTATALEDAGFEVRDIVNHVFGSGFPKSLNVEKAGAGENWKGWGTALKPAHENWILVRKPLVCKTVAENVLEWGCGGINIDSSRIGNGSDKSKGGNNNQPHISGIHSKDLKLSIPTDYSQGRFPANFILSHNDDCELLGEKKVKLNGSGKCSGKTSDDKSIFGMKGNAVSYGDGKGTETVSDYSCTEGCAVAELDRQSGVLKSGARKSSSSANENRIFKLHGKECESSVGGASRFFYVAKASKKDKNEGCERLEEKDSSKMDGGEFYGNTTSKNRVSKNNHPTVKNTKLMSYLITLVTPPNGIVLDPFMGSGSTGVAALRDGFNFIGIEKESEYFEIAQARLSHIEIKQQELIYG